MSFEQRGTDLRPSKGLIDLENPCSRKIITDVRMRRSTAPMVAQVKKKIDYQRSSSQVNGIKSLRASYFGLLSFLLLMFLTASLLILPLILPPLPPPPFMLLLLPIGILALLMLLAFMSSNVRDLTYTYM
ncbi:hypothetical protein Nepgr_030453 [Nepenthes gracilis]|uniref:ARGOS-like protein n=1 Tax=Nepenthes gracilis TaxID=150966 RepID=A0AAD3TEL6_NEPGR|nr:hypothetical protein Nepgr_030453 [Nepenthes gracilis]